MEDILRFAIREAEALGAEAEVYMALTKESEVFIENNDLKQVKSQSACGLGIQVIVNRSPGFYAINSLEKERVRRAVERAVKMAAASPRDRFHSLPVKSKVVLLRGIFDPNAKAFGATDAAMMAIEMLKTARSADSRISVDSGNFTATLVTHFLANSNGIALRERLSVFSWSIMGMAIDGAEVSSFDYQSGGSHSVRGVDVRSTAAEFAQNVRNSLGAQKIGSFRGEMLLAPSAAIDLVEDVIAHSINSDAVLKKSSHFADKVGKVVASNIFTVEDDATNTAGLAASSFDREGVPHRRNIVIEKGVLKKFLYNTYTARKDGAKKSTGNASGSTSSPPSVSTTNLVVSPGRSNLDILVSEIKHGIMISRFSGNVNQVNGDFSGVVKGGRVVKNGVVGGSVREVMVAGNVFECLKNLTGLSRERKVIGSSILPYMRFGGVSFTAG